VPVEEDLAERVVRDLVRGAAGSEAWFNRVGEPAPRLGLGTEPGLLGPPATTSRATTHRRRPTSSLRPRKMAASTTVQSTPVPINGAVTVTRARSSAANSVAWASAVTSAVAIRKRASAEAWRSRFGTRAFPAFVAGRLGERVGQDVLDDRPAHVVPETERDRDRHGEHGAEGAVVDWPLALTGPKSVDAHREPQPPPGSRAPGEGGVRHVSRARGRPRRIASRTRVTSSSSSRRHAIATARRACEACGTIGTRVSTGAG
jgi:hypothetical protein